MVPRLEIVAQLLNVTRLLGVNALCRFQLRFRLDPPSQRFFGQLIVARSHRPLGMVLPLLDVAIFLIDFFLRELLLDKLVA